MKKSLNVSALALLLALGTACGDEDKKTDSGADAGTQVDSGTDAGPIEPTCEAPDTDPEFLNQGECGDPRVECEPFDNTRIPPQP